MEKAQGKKCTTVLRTTYEKDGEEEEEEEDEDENEDSYEVAE